MTRDHEGMPLQPGVNVDAVDIVAGCIFGGTIGYDDERAQIVIEAALHRWKRGEEASAARLWLSKYPRDLTSWLMILAAAITAGERALDEQAVRPPDAVQP